MAHGVPFVIALGFVGAASNIMNQAMEHNLDKIMSRTSDRPIPSGRVEEMEAKGPFYNLCIDWLNLSLCDVCAVGGFTRIFYVHFVFMYLHSDED